MLPQNKELKIGEKEIRTEERKEVPAADIITHAFIVNTAHKVLAY